MIIENFPMMDPILNLVSSLKIRKWFSALMVKYISFYTILKADAVN